MYTAVQTKATQGNELVFLSISPQWQLNYVPGCKTNLTTIISTSTGVWFDFASSFLELMNDNTVFYTYSECVLHSERHILK